MPYFMVDDQVKDPKCKTNSAQQGMQIALYTCIVDEYI